MKKIKIFMALMLTIISLVVIAPVQANAAYSYYENYTFSTGALWWKEDFYAFVYRDPNWFTVFYGSPSTSTGYEYKNNTQIVLNQTTSFSIGAQTKGTLSGNVNFTSYGVPATVGGSIESTVSASWGVSNSTTRTILASAPKGYYSYNVCINIYKVKIKKYDDTGSYVSEIVFSAPRSQPYRSIIYNQYNATYDANCIRY
ncbi:MAG: hypothetical protein PHN99_04155 [Eubacteriales bacterium]|nr:hypothetical protein [Eubacteriales bacterium]MDD4328115.1 hypothetical protein [Eubacteriales bacterium]MDD4717286.1 hypothetical protein [Eubacteriales bacterium]